MKNGGGRPEKRGGSLKSGTRRPWRKWERLKILLNGNFDSIGGQMGRTWRTEWIFKANRALRKWNNQNLTASWDFISVYFPALVWSTRATPSLISINTLPFSKWIFFFFQPFANIKLFELKCVSYCRAMLNEIWVTALFWTWDNNRGSRATFIHKSTQHLNKLYVAWTREVGKNPLLDCWFLFLFIFFKIKGKKMC